jgi:hypothetical protein
MCRENIETLIEYTRGLSDELVVPRVQAFNLLINIIGKLFLLDFQL